MPLTLPTRPSAPPPPSPEFDEARPPLSRRKAVAGLAAAVLLLLCFGIGVGTDVPLLRMGSGLPKGAQTSIADKADANRAAEDRATARKVAAAKDADARAAADRAAAARAAQVAAARKRVVAVPVLVGLKLDVAMDLAADAGLTAVDVCRTPDGDTPLWWSNWRITGQDVPPGTRVDADERVCVSAAK
ncbi:PASTA domain-containing protein [Actinoplanes sp. NPDC049599]|uniref:PASTA domain-containing protein n=1 Tax=Actinoplanes sp. NPDC049599 TaxID=3363903 RepID=UPI0037B4361F